MSAVPTLVLNSGHQIPQVGLGTWLSKPGEVANAVKHAIKVGYRHLDCAYVYQNQREIGGALKELFASGLVQRNDLFITSKIWNTCHSAAAAEGNLQTTLDELGLDYLDLCLVHWPMGYQEGSTELFPRGQDGKHLLSDVDYMETYGVLEKAKAAGKVRSIGVSNFNTSQLQRVLDNCTIRPAVLQVEVHPYFQQKELIKFCTDAGIHVTAYSPLGNPSPDHPVRKADYPNLLKDPKMAQIAAAHGKSTAQIALRFLVQRGLSVIPKSTNEQRIAENIQLFDFALSDAEMQELAALDTGRRVTALEGSKHSPYYPFEL